MTTVPLVGMGCTVHPGKYTRQAHFPENGYTPRKKFCRTFPSVKGFGLYIRAAREAAGYTPEDLAARLGRTKSTIYRIEDEETEPSVEQINALVSALPISAEELLRRMGVNLNPPTATLLPRQLVLDLLAMNPEEIDAVALLVHRSSGGGRPPTAPAQ